MIGSARIRVVPTAGLEKLVHRFLEGRTEDISTLTEALTREDFERIRVTGHNLNGTGAAFGFSGISEIGRSLEQAASRRDKAGIRQEIGALADYMQRVEVDCSGQADFGWRCNSPALR